MTERTLWSVWWIGTILIVMSWLNVAPIWLGWVGFAAACGSSLASVVQRRYWRPPSSGQRGPDSGDKTTP
jgi:hypothetical protein